MSHQPITRSQTTNNPSLLVLPLGIVQAETHIVNVLLPPPLPLAILPISNINYVAWDARSPLVVPIAPTVWAPIPVSALKAILKFIEDGSRTPFENLQDVVDMCLVHRVTNQNIALRFLVASFRGKALDWYHTLQANTIATWDQLEDPFYERLSNDRDRYSQYHQLEIIKWAPYEAMTDFNARFHITWKRIQIAIRPPTNLAFMLYLKSINTNISMMI